MLTEVLCCRNLVDDRLRRWFSGRSIDLFVWYADTEIYGFQICYDKRRHEHALTWTVASGWSHKAVDDGDMPGGINAMAILVPDGYVPVTRIIDEFEVAAQDLDPRVLAFVAEKLPEAWKYLR